MNILSWMQKGVARQLVLLVSASLMVVTVTGMTITHLAVAHIEQNYQSLIFGQIIPSVLRMGEDHFQREERALQTAEQNIVQNFLRQADTKAVRQGQYRYPADGFRDHIPDRRIRGGVDKPGAVFVTVLPDGLVWIFAGLHDAEGRFQGVQAQSYAAEQPELLAEQWRTGLDDLRTALQQRKSKLTDDMLAVASVKGLIEPVMQQVQDSRDEISSRTLQTQALGVVVLLLVSAAGGSLVAVLLLRLSSVIVFQARSMEHMVQDLGMVQRPILQSQSQRADELGLLARGTMAAADAFGRIRQLEVERIEAGQQAARERSELLARMAERLQSTVDDVVCKVGQTSDALQGEARTMIRTVDLTVRESGQATQQSHQSHQQMQTISAAAGQLSDSIRSMRRDVERSLTIAHQAADRADETRQTAQSLSESACRIGDVVSLISIIAAKTNLLAMNATIEAARAGEAGKGFAVVANEVKGLAVRTAEATVEIDEQVRLISTRACQLSGDIERISAVIQDVHQLSNVIAQSMGEQLSATDDIAGSIEQAAGCSQSVVSSIDLVSDTAQQAEQASHGVMASSQSLETLSQQLRGALDSFLSNVRHSGLKEDRG